MGNNKISCKHVRGNGAELLVCELTNKRCPFQRWCNIRRIYELKSTIVECKDFSAKQK